MVRPIDSDRQAGEQIAQIGWPQIEQLPRHVAVPVGHLDLDDGQGEGDGEHRIGERLQPGRAARGALTGKIVAVRRAMMWVVFGQVVSGDRNRLPAIPFPSARKELRMRSMFGVLLLAATVTGCQSEEDFRQRWRETAIGACVQQARAGGLPQGMDTTRLCN